MVFSWTRADSYNVSPRDVTAEDFYPVEVLSAKRTCGDERPQAMTSVSPPLKSNRELEASLVEGTSTKAKGDDAALSKLRLALFYSHPGPDAPKGIRPCFLRARCINRDRPLKYPTR